ncbi:hypothetical protein OH773_08250 [Buttiauxella sp. WJP83]|uniref:hypothetical protein n=1 Tax=Buttiauxella sp. WJP83 TaxID=2986951 RepID=UPI0022DE755C|nr:hypothetical protein [Buttiauxella sp. WJP83]WBM72214.1 hypothetical protein OH773_08250 [Buttiauxella sp. WJP83]
MPLLAVFLLTSLSALATTYRTDSFGATRVIDHDGKTTTYLTDSFGSTPGNDGSVSRTDSSALPT